MDPFSRAFEVPPRTASVIHWPEYEWQDAAWMKGRASATSLSAPWSVYEVQ